MPPGAAWCGWGCICGFCLSVLLPLPSLPPCWRAGRLVCRVLSWGRDGSESWNLPPELSEASCVSPAHQKAVCSWQCVGHCAQGQCWACSCDLCGHSGWLSLMDPPPSFTCIQALNQCGYVVTQSPCSIQSSSVSPYVLFCSRMLYCIWSSCPLRLLLPVRVSQTSLVSDEPGPFGRVFFLLGE